MDGEDHRAYRGLTQAWFMPGNLKKLEARTAELAKRYVDLMMGEGAQLRLRARDRGLLSAPRHHVDPGRAGERRAVDAEADAGIVRRHRSRSEAQGWHQHQRDLRFLRLLQQDDRRAPRLSGRGSGQRHRQREAEGLSARRSGDRVLLHHRRHRRPRHDELDHRRRPARADRESRRDGEAQSQSRTLGPRGRRG